jgi:hypothetical protein
MNPTDKTESVGFIYPLGAIFPVPACQGWGQDNCSKSFNSFALNGFALS